MTRAFRFCSALTVSSLILAACGGGSGPTAVPAGPSQSKPPSVGRAALSFFVASKTGSARTKRPAYLPSMTQSIVVNVFNGDGTPTNPETAPVVTNLNSSSCTAVTGGQLCAVTVTVPTQALLFAVAAYAQPNGTGALLSSSVTPATIGSGPNNVSVTLNAQTQYVGTNLSGGGMQSVTIDHQAGTFQVATSSGASASSGTFTTLPNGDLKFTVTSATDGTTIGSIAYVHEMANGAAMFVATNTTTPNPDGSSNSADFGVMTAVQSCPTSNATFPVNVVDVAGPSFPANVSSREAYATGTATLTGAALSFAGTSYTLAGTSLGASSSQPATCANSVFTDPTGGSVVYDAQGLVVVSSAPSDGMPVQTGNLGFRAPSQPYSLSALASQTYEMYSAGFITVNGITSKVEAPYVVTPGGASSLTGCPYVNFETNSAGTSGCTTITFNAQPSPGIVTGTATSGASTTPFVAAVGQINGKYVLVALSSPTSGSGAAVNLTLMQQ